MSEGEAAPQRFEVVGAAPRVQSVVVGGLGLSFLVEEVVVEVSGRDAELAQAQISSALPTPNGFGVPGSVLAADAYASVVVEELEGHVAPASPLGLDGLGRKRNA